MCGQKYKIRNDCICGEIGVQPIDKKITENRLGDLDMYKEDPETH